MDNVRNYQIKDVQVREFASVFPLILSKSDRVKDQVNKNFTDSHISIFLSDYETAKNSVYKSGI